MPPRILSIWPSFVGAGQLIAVCGVLLGSRDASSPLPRPFTNAITGLAVTIGVVIAVATFAMEGFHFLLPDDPAHYELFR